MFEQQYYTMVLLMQTNNERIGSASYNTASSKPEIMRHLEIMNSTSMFMLKKNGRHQKGAALKEIQALGK